jgi:hypothetical protein
VQWTEAVAAAVGPAPPTPTGPSDALHWVVPVDRTWQAVTAGYVGLLSIVIVFLGPIAVALGIFGLRSATGNGRHGRGRSIFGIVTGLWGTFWTVVLLLTA